MGSTVKEIGVVILFIAVLALIVGTILGNSVFNDIGATGTVTNETGAYINATGYTLADASVAGFSSPTITALFNATDDTIILVGNASVSSVGVVTNSTVTNWENVTLSYTYSRTSGTNVAGVNVTNLSNAFGGFVTGLIAFFAIAGVLIGILFLIKYVVKLFSKDDGLGGITA